jgi:glutathione synthase/RimK-type ligase-like ATP-grasp enzyme
MIVPAPLYTKYIKKISEYRVHVVGNAVIDVQKKMRRTDIPDEQVNWQVRSHSNGFIFGREGVVLPDAVTADCVRCVNELGLDFGAVDVIFNAHQETYYVLEVNTAPGLTGTTLVNYANALTNLANS